MKHSRRSTNDVLAPAKSIGGMEQIAMRFTNMDTLKGSVELGPAILLSCSALRCHGSSRSSYRSLAGHSTADRRVSHCQTESQVRKAAIEESISVTALSPRAKEELVRQWHFETILGSCHS